MKIFLAGATGALGRRLLPLLAAAGHEVTGATRSAQKADALRAQGARSVVMDALDPDAVTRAVLQARPEVVVHQLTAIGHIKNLRRFDDAFAPTNRLRTEGTDHLIAAARAAGARGIVAQSFAGWPYAREGGPVKTEDDPLDPRPTGPSRRTLEAIRHLETAITHAEPLEGVVLRYGGFYGPGTWLGEGGDPRQLDVIRRRRFPLVAPGSGVWSFVHIDDAAHATLAAIEHGRPGIYNVVDDDPAPVADWLPELAALLGAKPPRRVPAWLGRLATGEHGIAMMNEVRGASNEKARRELGWRPHHPSWREGFRAELTA